MAADSQKPNVWPLLLLAVGLFHAAHNLLYLLQSEPPPSYDCGFHLQLSLNFLERFLDFQNEAYFSNLLRSSGYYPILGYAAATPFYLALGVSQDSAILSNLVFFALLLWSVYGIGRRLSSPEVGLVSATLVSFFPFVFGISRVYYLESALMAMVAWSVWRLLATEGFSKTGASILFGLSVGLGMMTKWTFALFLVGPTVFEVCLSLYRVYRNQEAAEEGGSRPAKGWSVPFLFLGVVLVALAFRSERTALWAAPASAPLALGAGFLTQRGARIRLWNLAVSGLLAAAVCYPWYVIYWDHIFSVAVAHIHKSPFGLENLLYYPLALQNNQVGPGFFFLLLLTPFLFPRDDYRKYATIAVWAAGGYLFLTFIPFAFNDPRFIAPYLPSLGLLMGKALLSVRRAFLRNMLLALAVLNGIWQFGMNTYEWPMPAGNNMKLTRYGYITLWNHGIYGTGVERGLKWPNEDIVETFEGRFSPEASERLPRLRLLIDRPCFHQGAFQFYARARSGGWEAVFDRDTIPLEKELVRTMDAEGILFANTSQWDDFYLGLGQRKPFEFNQNESSFFPIRFPEQLVYDLPDDTSVTLAFQSGDRMVSGEEGAGQGIGPNVQLAAASYQYVPGATGGLSVTCQWTLSLATGDATEATAVLGIWTLEGELRLSKGQPLPPTGGVTEFHLSVAELSTTPLDPTSVYQLSVGFQGDLDGGLERPPTDQDPPGAVWRFFREPIAFGSRPE